MADEDCIDLQGLAIRGLPSKIPNLARGPVRASQFGELVTKHAGQARQTLADQGTYFLAHNATNDAATTLLGHADPELADNDATMTKALVHMRHAPTSSVFAYLDFIEIEVVTAPTNGAKDNWAAQLDTGATRVSSGGTALTAVNSNMQSTRTADLAILGGAIVTGAESPSARQLGHGQNRAAIAIIGDRYMFRFGEEPSCGDNVVATAASRHLINLPPVILGPTDQLLLGLYTSDDAQTVAGVYKIRVGWWEL
jgi:hypothetical protein